MVFVFMEIDEFLTKISLSSADPTIFTLYEKGKNVTPTGKEVVYNERTLKIYTRAEDSGVVGTIKYDKPFPKQIFAMEPSNLKNILFESDEVDIDGTYLVATGKMDFKWKLQVLGSSKTMDFSYEREDILLTKDVVAKIIRADRIMDTSAVKIVSDGNEVVIEISGKIRDNTVKLKIPVVTKPFDAMYEKRFIECIKLAGERDVYFNVDGRKKGVPNAVRGAGKLEITDDNAKITYYITEVTRSVNEERKSVKSEQEKDADMVVETDGVADSGTTEETGMETDTIEETIGDI
jgi:hypothetical protein